MSCRLSFGLIVIVPKLSPLELLEKLPHADQQPEHQGVNI